MVEGEYSRPRALPESAQVSLRKVQTVLARGLCIIYLATIQYHSHQHSHISPSNSSTIAIDCLETTLRLRSGSYYM